MKLILAIIFASAAFAANAQKENVRIIRSAVPCQGYEGQAACYKIMHSGDSIFGMTYTPVIGIEKLSGDTCEVLMKIVTVSNPAPDESPEEYHILKIIACENN